jgi:hypothetical protein
MTEALRKDGMGPLIEALGTGALRPERAIDEISYAIAEARWAAARTVLPELDTLAHEDRHALVGMRRLRPIDFRAAFRRFVVGAHAHELTEESRTRSL